MNPMEPHETMPHKVPETGPRTGVQPPRLFSSFVFIDLREDPEAWVQIENELAEDNCFTRH